MAPGLLSLSWGVGSITLPTIEVYPGWTHIKDSVDDSRGLGGTRRRTLNPTWWAAREEVREAGVYAESEHLTRRPKARRLKV